MRITIFLSILVLLQISCQQDQNELEGSWILVENKAHPNAGFIPILRGGLIHFENGKYTASYTTNKENYETQYYLDGDTIKTDSSIIGRIIHLSKDSLLIDTDSNWYVMHFRPLKPVLFSANQKEELMNQLVEHPWTTTDKNLKSTYKLFCRNEKWGERFEENEAVKMIVYQKEMEDHKSLSEYEYWTIKDFKGKLIFSFSSGGLLESSHFQILEYDEETIKGNFINWMENNWYPNYLERLESNSKQQLDSIQSLITGEWKINNLINPTANVLNRLSDSPEIVAFGKTEYDNRISLNDLEKRNLSFLFSQDKEYKILAGEKVIRTGNDWGTTKDGNYLFLDTDLTGNNLIEIITLNEHQLHIQYSAEISLPGKHQLASKYVDLEIDLKRKTEE